MSTVSILFASIMSSRHIFETSSRRVTRPLKDMSSRRLQYMSSSTHLQDMSSRRHEDVFSVTVFRLPTRLQDVFKTNKCLVCQTDVVNLV